MQNLIIKPTLLLANRNGIESAMKSIDTKSIKAPEGQGCPRCGGSVFAAEQMLSKGRVN
jgi:hypothetical protein